MRQRIALAVTLSLLTSTSACTMRRSDRMLAGGFGTAMAIGGGALVATTDLDDDRDSAVSGIGKGLAGYALVFGGLALALGGLLGHDPAPPPAQ